MKLEKILSYSTFVVAKKVTRSKSRTDMEATKASR